MCNEGKEEEEKKIGRRIVKDWKIERCRVEARMCNEMRYSV